MAAGLTEPVARWGHFSATVGGRYYVWGGHTENFSAADETFKTIHCFDPFLESWTVHECNGAYPPGIYDGACASEGHHLYVYGGTDGSRCYNSLHQLDTRSWTWKELSSTGPIRKTGSGMVVYDNQLVLFGGCGYSISGAEYVARDGSSDGKSPVWTNELHTFDLKKGKSLEYWVRFLWSDFKITGTIANQSKD